MSPNPTGQPRETGKQRTGRINLDYYKTRDRLTRGKLWLSVVAALAVVFWVSGLGWDVRGWANRSERTLSLITPGPLARVHATWDAECEACHVPFTPIDGSAWTARFVPHARGGDTHCQSCHDAGGHHEAVLTEDASSCASCHRDHRGRAASLVAVADQDCTRCHAALASHTKTGTALNVVGSVSQFDANRAHHPEFALFRDGKAAVDPGRIKFNHALHLTRGFTQKAGDPPLKTLADLAPEDRPRYREPGHKETEGIQLSCATCHRSEGDRGPGTGPLMKPIRFENDCRACHPLNFDPARPPLPHALTLAGVDQALWQSYSADYLQEHPDLKETRTFRPIPGHADRPEIVAARRIVGDRVTKAEKTIFGEKRCAECHHYLDAAAGNREVATLTAWDPKKDIRVAPQGVPDVWFKKAAFDHSAHQAVSCRLCHAQAYPDDAKASHTNADVMLPNLAVCQTCHAPRARSATSVTGGAGYNCAECHRYHGESLTAPGSGPLARGNASRADLKQFLLGTLNKAPR